MEEEDKEESQEQQLAGEPELWTLNKVVLIRHHRAPRLKTFMPEEIDMNSTDKILFW